MGIMTAQEKISFTSANPFSFKDIITDLEGQTPHEVHGFLRLPETTQEGPYPLIIGVAGSLDWAEQHFEYLEMYRQMGIATFEMQSFASRGISSTVGTQVDVTTGMIILDVYRAFEKLAEDPRIDKDRVGITGWSLGGAVTLFSGWLPLKEKINTDLEFAAHLAFYPPCFIDDHKSGREGDVGVGFAVVLGVADGEFCAVGFGEGEGTLSLGRAGADDPKLAARGAVEEGVEGRHGFPASGAGGVEEGDEHAGVSQGGQLEGAAAGVDGVDIERGSGAADVVFGPKLLHGIHAAAENAFGDAGGFAAEAAFRGWGLAVGDVLALLHDAGELADAVEGFLGVFLGQTNVGIVAVLERGEDAATGDE